MRNKKIIPIALFLLMQAPAVWACPLCLLGLAEFHIANFEFWLMNMVPLLAPALTGLALYRKDIMRRIRG